MSLNRDGVAVRHTGEPARGRCPGAAAVALAIAAAGLLAGCGAGASSARSAAAGLPPTPSASACPPASAGRVPWPSGIPTSLPVPPGTSSLTPVKSALRGLTVVSFDTPTSLRDSVIWVVRQVPRAGYFLGRGDAEQTEADAPFAGAGYRGTFRMAMIQPCSTRWLVAAIPQATVPGAGAATSPLLPMRRVSPSPLPFAP